MRNRTRAAAAVVAMLFAFTACAPDGGEGNALTYKGAVYQHQVHLEDGRTVTCVSWASAYAGGIQCDCEGAK